jgi:hypothetical protein
VKKHVFNLCSKLHVQSRAQAIAKARKLQLVYSWSVENRLFSDSASVGWAKTPSRRTV